MTLTVLLGPKTRLGREVIARLQDEPVIAIARDAADVTAVAAVPGLAAGDVVDASTGELGRRLAEGDGPVRLVVAALGPVHPDRPRAAYDAARVERDLGFVEQVLASGRPVRIVYVSTVIALAPGEDRRYYGGWKALLEQQLQQLVDDRCAGGGEARLAVLYPGRLVEAAEHRGRRRLHTSYPRLAELVIELAERPVGRTVGTDSRIWLLARSISLTVGSLVSTTNRSLPRPPGSGGGRENSGESG